MLFSKVLMPGEVLADEFCVDELIGEGGYSFVYSGYRLSDEMPVVIKCPREGIEKADDVAWSRFVREAKAMMSIDHPNVVRTLGFGHHSSRPYIVMERLIGLDLARLMFRAPMAQEHVGHILTQILDAMVMAHDLDLVIRDLKPANVFVLGEPGQAPKVPYSIKILDFGLVKSVADAINDGFELALTQEGQRVGTPGYIAPEIILYQPVTPLADIYSAGVMGYELLIGAPAFGLTGHERLKRQRKGQITTPPMSARSSPLMPIVLRMMELDPKRRYQTAQEVLRAIERLRARPSLWRRIRRFFLPRR